MSLLKSFKGEAELKEKLNQFYKKHGMIEDSFQRNFVAHKTIDYLFGEGHLDVGGGENERVAQGD